jgi:PAS domain S-box-containing protein
VTLRRSVPSGLAAQHTLPGPLALGAVAWLLAYAVWASVATPYQAAWEFIVDESATIPLRVMITVLAFRLALAPGIPRSTMIGWRFFGSAFAIGAATNVVRALVSPGVTLPAWIRLTMAVPLAICLLVGLWKLARVRQDSGHAADWFDAGVIVLSGFLLSSYFVAGGNPFSASHLGATRILFLIYLLVDVIAVWFTATAWFRRPTGVARQALGLITLGFAVVAIVDLLYDQAIQRGSFSPGGLIDVTVAIGFVLIILGLDVQRQQRVVVAPERRAMRQGRHVVAPIAIVAATLPLLWTAWANGRGTAMPFLVTGIALLLVLVLIRQHIARSQAWQAAHARAAADARFRSLVQRSSDAIFQIAPDHRIQWASPSAGELTGSIPSLLTGRRISELAHPEDRDRLTVFLANAGEPFSRNAVLRWRLGRAETWHEVESVVSNLSADEAVGGLVLNTRDVSERVRLEQQLRQAQKLEAVGRLAGGIAHDFNNILAAIITHSQLVRDELEPGDERAADLLEIEQTAQRGAVLTRRLLSFSRPEAGELRAQPLIAVVRGMEPMLRRLLVSQVELWLDLTDEELWVRTADGQIEQILMNLAINARDAMPDGGVVHVRARQRHVRPGDRSATRGMHTGTWAELTVRDEGVGMDADTLARLFEPFFTTKPSGLGTGLGLATVRGIVRALGGHVTAESEPDKGTTMLVLLPLVPAEAPLPVEVEVDTPAHTSGRPVVLVVDDEVTLRRAMERYLTRHEYETIGAASALDALAILEAREWAVDLIVTDMVMPRMGGREFVRRIHQRAPQVPVLCISGHMEWEAEDADEPEAPWSREKLLAKPFPFTEFLQRVREALGGATARV